MGWKQAGAGFTETQVTASMKILQPRWHRRCTCLWRMNDRKTSKPTRSEETQGRRPTRRAFLKQAGEGLGLAMLMNSLPRGWAGSVRASDAPEITDMRF